jgi:hypothetical protein
MLNGTTIPAYVLPTDMSINPTTGRITWVHPNQIGSWSFAVLVKKWRQQIQVGASIIDYTILTLPDTAIAINPTINTTCTQNNDSTYSCIINQLDSVGITISYPNSNIHLYSENLANSNFTFSSSTATFHWNTTSQNARHNPYKLTFRIDKNIAGSIYSKDITFFVTILDTTQSSCATPPNLNGIKNTALQNNIVFFPNPANDEITIQSNITTNTTAIITNTFGQTIKSVHLKGNNTFIDISDLKSGIYIMQLNGEHVKFLKE